MKNTSRIIYGLFFTLQIVGCDATDSVSLSQIPEVNDENCKTENIAKIVDEEIREKFFLLCKKRPNGAPTSIISNTPTW